MRNLIINNAGKCALQPARLGYLNCFNNQKWPKENKELRKKPKGSTRRWRFGHQEWWWYLYHDCYLFKLKMVDSPKPKDFHGQCEDGVREHHGSLGIFRCWYGESSYQWPGLFTGNQGMEQRQSNTSNMRFHQDWIDWKGIQHSNGNSCSNQQVELQPYQWARIQQSWRCN